MTLQEMIDACTEQIKLGVDPNTKIFTRHLSHDFEGTDIHSTDYMFELNGTLYIRTDYERQER